MFLLDDTNLPLTSEDIAQACKDTMISIFRQNKIFKDIVRREVQQMFKEKKIIDLATSLANTVAARIQQTDLRKKQEAAAKKKAEEDEKRKQVEAAAAVAAAALGCGQNLDVAD